MVENGGCEQRCYDTYNSWHCGCEDGYTLVNTKQACPGVAACSAIIIDLVFVVDSSGSIRDMNPADGSYDNWNLILDFIVDVVESLNIGQDAVRVGMVIYSQSAQNVFFLNSYFSQAEIGAAVLAAPYMGSFTNTADGIHLMRQVQFTAANGDRADVPNIAIVITDGESNLNKDDTVPAAQLAQQQGVKMFSLGVTEAVNEVEVAGISQFPQEYGKNWFMATDFTTLGDIISDIVSSTCTVDPCPGLDADIVFIVDSSGSIRDANPPDGSVDNWALTLEFIATFIDQLNIGPEASQVGLVRFSFAADNIFFLDSYHDKANLISAVLNTGYIGSFTNTSGGLRAATFEQFVPAAGDRPHHDNIAIVITDGQPNLDAELTVPDAAYLRSLGTQVFAVGVTDLVEAQLLQQISSEPQLEGENYFLSTDFDSLQLIGEQVSARACRTSEQYCWRADDEGWLCQCVFDECDAKPLNGTRCEDVDECAEHNGLCSHACVNTPGAYYCTCPAGLALHADAHTCTDVDECVTEPGVQCPAGTECVNTWGAYYCIASQSVHQAQAVALAGLKAAEEHNSQLSVLLLKRRRATRHNTASSASTGDQSGSQAQAAALGGSAAGEHTSQLSVLLAVLAVVLGAALLATLLTVGLKRRRASRFDLSTASPSIGELSYS